MSGMLENMSKKFIKSQVECQSLLFDKEVSTILELNSELLLSSCLYEKNRFDIIENATLSYRKHISHNFGRLHCGFRVSDTEVYLGFG